jgi:hypothetical protein
MMKRRFTVRAHDAKTLSWWMSRREAIDMSPPYQRRGRLWSPADKAYLIDSIINEFDIPKLYVADFTYGNSLLNTKKLPYAIIDGKQRLEAVFDFFRGDLCLNPDFVFLNNTHLKLGGLKYRELKSKYRDIAEIFDNFNLSVMSVITDDAEMINALFVRLNRNKPLTGAEIRNAMPGPAPEIIRRIAEHEFFRDCISFKVTRGEDKNAAAKLLLFEFENGPTETKKATLDKFVDSSKLASNKDKLELAARRVLANLNALYSVFLPKDALLSSSGVIPVYYWFIRSVDEGSFPSVRGFLASFEAERKANRKNRALEQRPTENLDQVLTTFDQLNRNTNDIRSHRERISILLDRSGFSIRT